MLERGQLLSEDDYLTRLEEYGDEFSAVMGAEAYEHYCMRWMCHLRWKNCAPSLIQPLLKPKLKYTKTVKDT